MSQRVLDFLSRPEVWAIASALAGFLTLTWVLRGAPIGQATREEPGGAPSSSSIATAWWRSAVDRVPAGPGRGDILAAAVGIPWSLPAFAAGFGIVLAVLRVNRRYRHVSPTLRRALDFSTRKCTSTASLGGGES